MEYKELTKNYSDDYFCEPMQQTLTLALELIESVKNGSFEYDTHQTDTLLWFLKYAINKIDI